MPMEARLIILDDREEASALAAELAALHLSRALTRHGKASFMASGGSSPWRMFSLLSRETLDWSRVTVGLVDDRWVPADDAGSNERGIREKLLQGPAAQAGFLPMKTADELPFEGVAARTQEYAPHCAPVSSVLLGMGPDGHTASWFPGDKNLDRLLHPPAGEILAGVDAGHSPVAGEFRYRMSLTATPVCDAEAGILLIFGDDKRSVLEQSLVGDEREFPVRRAIDGLGSRLSIIWAP